MMDRMDDLIAFLRARLDEDEEIARAAGAGPGPAWRYDADGGWVRATREDDGIATGHQEYLDLEHGQHIARHDPARVLAEVDAKRQMIELHGIVHRSISWLDDGTEEGAEIPVCSLCVPRHSSFRTRTKVPEGACATVRLLALPYANHPGYRDTWRP